MDNEAQVAEPVVDRWAERKAFSQRGTTAPRLDLSIFRLSGGVMKPAGQIEKDDIEGLLSHVMNLPTSGSYQKNIDRNLDYLYTSIQLDIISSIADRCSIQARQANEALNESFLQKE